MYRLEARATYSEHHGQFSMQLNGVENTPFAKRPNDPFNFNCTLATRHKKRAETTHGRSCAQTTRGSDRVQATHHTHKKWRRSKKRSRARIIWLAGTFPRVRVRASMPLFPKTAHTTKWLWFFGRVIGDDGGVVVAVSVHATKIANWLSSKKKSIQIAVAIQTIALSPFGSLFTSHPIHFAITKPNIAIAHTDFSISPSFVVFLVCFQQVWSRFDIHKMPVDLHEWNALDTRTAGLSLPLSARIFCETQSGVSPFRKSSND